MSSKGWEKNSQALSLRIQREQIDLASFVSSQVDDPDTTELARSFPHPAYLADATRATNDGASFWVQCNEARELGAFVFVPVTGPQLLEDRAFDDGKRAATVRLKRIAINVPLL